MVLLADDKEILFSILTDGHDTLIVSAIQFVYSALLDKHESCLSRSASRLSMQGQS